MRGHFRAAGWILLALAVLAVAVGVGVGALQAHSTTQFNRWVGWANVAATIFAGAAVLLLVGEKITGNLVRLKMHGGNSEGVSGVTGPGGPGRGHVSITSGKGASSQTATPVDLEEFSRAEAVRSLLRRSGSDDAEAAWVLARALGDLPEALAQAVTSDQLDADQAAAWAERVLNMIVAIVPPDRPEERDARPGRHIWPRDHSSLGPGREAPEDHGWTAGGGRSLWRPPT